jgi:hypothetical protein
VNENTVLTRIIGLKRGEITVGFRKLHNEELHNLYFPPSIIRVIISRIMRWARRLTRMGEIRNAQSGWEWRPKASSCEADKGRVFS